MHITKEDLSRIYIRAKDENGSWDSISLQDASHVQFQSWAETKMEIVGDDDSWSLDERVDFCNALSQYAPIYRIKPSAED